MSHIATNWAFQQRGLKPSAKIILLVLADCHNPAYGCFPTQAFIADACEMNRDTVNVQLAHLEAVGLIQRIRSVDPKSKRQRPTRYKLAFEADFAATDEGEATPETPRKAVSEKPTQTAKAVSEIPAKPCRKNPESRVGNSDTNLVREPVSEPCANAHTHSVDQKGFEEFWKAHPKVRNQDRTKKLFVEAVASGVDAQTIIRAAVRYRAENAGNSGRYIASSENWLGRRRWEDYAQDASQGLADEEKPDMAAFWAAKIKAGRYVAPTAIKRAMAAEMVQRGLVHEQALSRIGIQL